MAVSVTAAALVARVRGAFSATTDPQTGDHLSAGERVSWGVQHVMRRWSWVLGTQLVTLVCWLWGTHNANVLVWWNLSASDYAVIVESLTAMVLILQQMRDAVVTRHILAMAEQNVRMEREHGELLQAILAEVRSGGANERRDPKTGRFTKKLEKSA